MHRLRTRLWSRRHLKAACFFIFSAPLLAYADAVNMAQITTFVDGQPAVAAEVNDNFQELINQINDNDSKIGLIRSIGLTSGDEVKDVACGDDPQALRSAIDLATNHTSMLYLNVTGICDPVSIVDRRRVVINGGTIKGSVASENVVNVRRSEVLLIAVTVDADGSTNGVNATQASLVTLLGSTIKGASQSQVLMGASQILFLNQGNVIGSGTDSATGLDLFASQAYLTALGGFPLASLDVNSNGAAMILSDSLFEAGERVPGTTSLTINAAEVGFEGASVGVLGPSSIAVSDRFSVTDNSVVTIEGIDATESFSLNGRVLIDRGGILRFDLEENPDDISVVHQGNMEIGLNSVVDAYGSEGNPDTVLLVSDGTLEVNVNASFVANSATVGATDIVIRNATVVFGPNTSFSGDQPNISVLYDGTFIDLDSGGLLTGDVTECSTGGSAYGMDPNDPVVCP